MLPPAGQGWVGSPQRYGGRAVLEADEAADIEEVNAPDRVALVDQVASQVMTDEATGPGDQDGWLLGH
jgi:hypothetical protein